MKKFFLGLLTLFTLNGYSANLTEAFYLESSKGSDFPDILISVFDDGTCLSESDNFDGRKAIDAYLCDVTESSFINISGLKEVHCYSSAHFNGLSFKPEVSTLKRQGNKVYIDGIDFVKASAAVIKKYKMLSPCSYGIYKD